MHKITSMYFCHIRMSMALQVGKTYDYKITIKMIGYSIKVICKMQFSNKIVKNQLKIQLQYATRHDIKEGRKHRKKK